MARMNLRLRRDAPGVSVFWIILVVGAGVFLLVALLLYSTGDDMVVEPAEPDIIAGEGDELPGTTSFTEGQVAEQPTPPDIPGAADEVDESVPETGQADDDSEAGTAGRVDADPAAPAPEEPLPGAQTGTEGPEEGVATELPAEGEAEAIGGEAEAPVGEQLQEEVEQLEDELQD